MPANVIFKSTPHSSQYLRMLADLKALLISLKACLLLTLMVCSSKDSFYWRTSNLIRQIQEFTVASTNQAIMAHRSQATRSWLLYTRVWLSVSFTLYMPKNWEELHLFIYVHSISENAEFIDVWALLSICLELMDILSHHNTPREVSAISYRRVITYAIGDWVLLKWWRVSS